MSPSLVISDLVSYLLNELERDALTAPKFERVFDVRQAWRSLLFCILSSQVRAASAKRAAELLLCEITFFPEAPSWREVQRRARQILRDEAGYRFPDTKARQIADSWFAFAQLGKNLYAYLDSFTDEKEARIAVSGLFPGLGMKQTSMFLRDIGYARQLCIIDTHILWYFSHSQAKSLRALTPKQYLEIESYLLAESERLRVPPNVFDSVVWAAVRTLKARQCTMRFV